ncbi:MAG: polysaccharide deacetylase family protein [Firmicutes bacterium]|nr:polysaccharide deacetylase family protein [Candidatus Fermentithermobacillaceae bacterium]
MLIFLTKATRTKLLILLCFCLVVIGARTGMELSRSVQRTTGARASPITRVSTNRPEAALMIDVIAANPEVVQEVRKALSRAGLRVTWFVSATWAESHPELLAALVQDGHEIGVKGTDDKRLDKLDVDELKIRLIRAREAIANAQVEPAPFFYPPGAKLGEAGVVAALEEGFHTVFGSTDLRNLKGKPEDISRKLNLMPGDIALIEVSGKTVRPPISSIEAVGAWAKVHGLTLVTISSLVKGVR